MEELEEKTEKLLRVEEVAERLRVPVSWRVWTLAASCIRSMKLSARTLTQRSRGGFPKSREAEAHQCP